MPETETVVLEAKELADKLADILGSNPHADFGMKWSWDEFWAFNNQLKALAGKPTITTAEIGTVVRE